MGILYTLSKDEDENVRAAVAKNPKISLDILKTLAKDENEDVRDVVAEHPKMAAIA